NENYLREDYLNENSKEENSTKNKENSNKNLTGVKILKENTDTFNRLMKNITEPQTKTILNFNWSLDCLITHIDMFSTNIKKFYYKIRDKLTAIQLIKKGEHKNKFIAVFITDKTFYSEDKFKLIRFIEHDTLEPDNLTEILNFCMTVFEEPWFDQLDLLILKDFCDDILDYRNLKSLKNKKLFDHLINEIKKHAKSFGIDLKIRNIKN
ncbi:hypothetical protein M153_158630001, partial [Pseudoloma neurophilia]